MTRHLAFPVVLVLSVTCGGTTTNIDGGADTGGSDASTSDTGSANDASSDVATNDGSGGPCINGACTGGLSCCDGECVDEQNDPHNCGMCGMGCISSGGTSAMMCEDGMCQAANCNPTCSTGQICCAIEEGVPFSQCVTGTTCPVGCPTCK